MYIIYEIGLRTEKCVYFGSKILLIKTSHALAYLLQKTDKIKQLQISQELFDDITNYEKELKTKYEYEIKERLTPLNEKVSVHFIFNLTSRTISRKLKSNFDGIVKLLRFETKRFKRIFN